MNRVHGERARSRQETCHLINSLPIVYCNCTFKKVNLRNNAREISLPEGDVENNRESNQIVTLKTIVDLYD